MSDQPETGLPPGELAKRILKRIQAGTEYASRRRKRFSRPSIFARMATLTLAALSTIILGLQELNLWTSLAFSFVALTTVIDAIEPFFNLRSRWIVMEEMLARFYRLESDLRHLLAKVGPESLTVEDLDEYHQHLQAIWDEASLAWIDSRRTTQ